MPQVINTNVYSITSRRALSRSQGDLATSMERLSSGLRINRAKDDAAGMAIGQEFTSQIKGLSQSIRNANDGISLVQTAEGGLEEVANMLQRMRELSVQSANGTYNSTDRSYLHDEFTELKAEITRVGEATQFNGIDVLGSGQALTIQVGAETGSKYTVTISTIALSATSATGVGSSLATATSISSVTAANSSMGILDTAIQKINDYRSQLGSKQNRLEHTVANMASVIENQTSARSRIMDADFAVETANMTRGQILQQAGTAMLAQANQMPSQVLSLLR